MNLLSARVAFCIVLLCAGHLHAFSQLQWQQVDSLFGPLPPSMHVYRSETPVDGKPNIAYYASIDLRAKDLVLTTQVGRGKRYTPSQFYELEGQPLLVVNGTFFSFADNRNLNVVIRNGAMQAYNVPAVRAGKNDSANFYYLTRSAIGINKKGKADVAWLFTDTALRYPLAMLNGPSTAKGPKADPSWPDLKRQISGGGRKKIKWKMETAIGGGPVLVQMGKPMITNVEERMFVADPETRHPRTAMGYTRDDRLIVLVVEGRHPGLAEGVGLSQEARILADLGCWEALNLDGGGSSTMLINGKPTITPSDKEGQRPVPAVLLVKKIQ